MEEQFLSYIREQNLFDKGTPLLVAVSGGKDSATLVQLLHISGFTFGIAHCNFKLRDAESDADEEFAEALAAEYAVPFHSVQFETSAFAKKHKISIQMAARQLRYEWLEQLRKDYQYHLIATAHHLNDSIETILLNFTRGTGLRGLHGILPKQEKVVRPLLFATQAEIDTYAERHALQWREDQSNFTTKYERNLLRLKVIPELKQINPSLEESFRETVRKLQEAELLFEQGLRLAVKKLVERRGQELFIPIRKLIIHPAHQTILYEILKNYGFSTQQLPDVAQALTSTPGKQFLSSTHRLIKDRDFLIISALTTDKPQTFLIDEKTKQIFSGSTRFRFQKATKHQITVKEDPKYAFLDSEKLDFPLVLRPWKKGDYFYPLGMKKKKKKLSKFFIDIKLSLIEKEQVQVLMSGERVAWVAGYRIDERFAVTPSTQNILKVSWHRKR